jgi:hypothetical protein
MPGLVIAGCLVGLLGSVPAPAGPPEDGIYPWTEGREGRVKRNDGAEVVLGQRLGRGLGRAALTSVRNDNSVFTLEPRGAGPLPEGADRSYLAVMIDGVCLGVWSHSDRRPDGTIDLSCTVHGDEAARRVAARLGVEPRRRKHPGHRFETRWAPEKESYRPGEAVTLKLEIRNTGEVPFTFWVGGQQRGPRDNQYRFLAYRTSGLGKAVPDTGDPTNFGGIMTTRTLKPGESFTASVSLDKWFNFPEADTYRVTGLFGLAIQDQPDSGFGGVTWDDYAVGDCLVRVAAGP